MPLVVGTDTYATEVELAAFAAARGITLSGDESVLLVKAMDYLESMLFKGDKADPDQPLQWPRVGTAYASDTVPDGIKNGQMLLAIDADSYELTSSAPGVKAKSVGDVSLTYADGSSGSRRPNAALSVLNPFLAGFGVSWVQRA